MARTDACEQAHGRPRIAEVEHHVGFCQAADADTVNAPAAVTRPFDGRPERAKRGRRGQYVFPF